LKLWYFIEKGGIFMYPILLCSILSLAIFLEKLWVLRKKRIAPKSFVKSIYSLIKEGKIDEAKAVCENSENLLSKIMLSLLQNTGKPEETLKNIAEDAGRRGFQDLERFLEGMATIASVSTLLGLLGTISGMIKIFSVISYQQVVDPPSLAGGISEALYTTAAGLTVAIPTIVGYKFLTGKISRLSQNLEVMVEDFIKLLRNAGKEV